MTPEQLAAHRAWHQSHAPGAADARRADRERARQNAEARELIAQAPRQRASSPERTRIETALAAAIAKLAGLEARASKSSDDNEGVFS
jgi:hypothetical protein